MIVTLIPAAGASSRMRGRDKLLEKIAGQPILRQTAIEAIRSDLGPVIVTLPVGDKRRRKALRNLDLTIVEVADASAGMSASLRAGAEWALPHLSAAPDPTSYEYHGLLVMLPDMPGPRARDLQAMASAHQARGGSVVRAVDAEGRHGHPVLFPWHLLQEFRRLSGDQGAFSLLDDEPIVEIKLEGDRATRDLDTPEDWAAWRAENGG